jgi:hypothetical protein
MPGAATDRSTVTTQDLYPDVVKVMAEMCPPKPEYRRILEAAKSEGPIWYAATCLAGEAGLRIGEVRAIRWREDVDLVAKTITVNTQLGNGRDEADESTKQFTSAAGISSAMPSVPTARASA